MAAKRRRLNRDAVVEEAATLADEAGQLEAVTLTALAERLDVRVPSLYNHVSGLADLRHALAVYAVTHLVEAVQPAGAGLVGREALWAMAWAYRRFAHAHPGIYGLTIRAPDADDAALQKPAQTLLQMLLLALGSMGLQGEEALHAVRGLRALLHGFVSLEAADGFKMALAQDESYARVLNAYLDGIALGSTG